MKPSSHRKRAIKALKSKYPPIEMAVGRATAGNVQTIREILGEISNVSRAMNERSGMQPDRLIISEEMWQLMVENWGEHIDETIEDTLEVSVQRVETSQGGWGDLNFRPAVQGIQD